MGGWVALSEIVRNAALAVAAFVGAYLAWRQLSPVASQARAASTQVELARRAIYVLREVAKDFPDLSNPIFELLQAYLRASEINYGDDQPPIDIQEIIKLLRGRLEILDA